MPSATHRIDFWRLKTLAQTRVYKDGPLGPAVAVAASPLGGWFVRLPKHLHRTA